MGSHAIHTFVDAATEYASPLLGSVLAARRLFPITLNRAVVRRSESYARYLMVRTLISLLRHAVQAVEIWWREATADFVETDIASGFFLHKIFSYHKQSGIHRQELQIVRWYMSG
jgi:hypothetical protein